MKDRFEFKVADDKTGDVYRASVEDDAVRITWDQGAIWYKKSEVLAYLARKNWIIYSDALSVPAAIDQYTAACQAFEAAQLALEKAKAAVEDARNDLRDALDGEA